MFTLLVSQAERNKLQFQRSFNDFHEEDTCQAYCMCFASVRNCRFLVIVGLYCTESCAILGHRFGLLMGFIDTIKKIKQHQLHHIIIQHNIISGIKMQGNLGEASLRQPLQKIITPFLQQHLFCSEVLNLHLVYF